MAKLYFYYSAMNAGKSTVLLQSAHNYQEQKMDVLLFTPEIDTRFAKGKIHSRIGLHRDAVTFNRDFNIYERVVAEFKKNPNIKCVLVDEAQFMNKQQVEQLVKVVDELNLPVLTYGLRSDYRGEPFEGSMYLLIWADNLVEIKTICHCGKKATMNAQFDSTGKRVREGEQVQIGGSEKYASMCRKHFNKD